MDPREIAGGKTFGIPNLLLIGGVILVAYFLFLRNKNATGDGATSTGGGGTITVGDTSVGSGAVKVNVTQAGQSSGSGGGGGAGGGGGGGGDDDDDKHHRKPRRRHPRKHHGKPPRRHPNDEETQGADPEGVRQGLPEPHHHRRHKSVSWMEGTK